MLTHHSSRIPYVQNQLSSSVKIQSRLLTRIGGAVSNIGMYYEIENLFADLIESAFLQTRIDGGQQQLA